MLFRKIIPVPYTKHKTHKSSMRTRRQNLFMVKQVTQTFTTYCNINKYLLCPYSILMYVFCSILKKCLAHVSSTSRRTGNKDGGNSSWFLIISFEVKPECSYKSPANTMIASTGKFLLLYFKPLKRPDLTVFIIKKLRVFGGRN